MGRRRKSFHHLPPRVQQKHGAYYFVHRDGHWERLAGLGEERAMRNKWAERYGVTADVGNFAWWLARFLNHREALVKRGNLAPRTYADNLIEADYLKAYFGKMFPADVRSHHVFGYRDQRGEVAPVRANREKALLSAFFTWLLSKADSGVEANPCKGVPRIPETKRVVLPDDADYQGVYKLANPPVQILMDLIYRTLQRPEDLIVATPRDIRSIEHGGTMVRVLRVRQQKTKRELDILVTHELDEIISRATGKVVALDQPFVHTRRGKRFTYGGLSAMFRRYVNKARDLDAAAALQEGRPPIFKPFGIYDIKGKGATDMYRAGIPIERIQQLLGHTSVRTTEIYLKGRLPEVVAPNSRKMGV